MIKTFSAALAAIVAFAAFPAESVAKSGYKKRHATMSQQDRASYRQSGTRGRMGLGANPRNPEGPGNVGTR